MSSHVTSNAALIEDIITNLHSQLKASRVQATQQRICAALAKMASCSPFLQQCIGNLGILDVISVLLKSPEHHVVEEATVMKIVIFFFVFCFVFLLLLFYDKFEFEIGKNDKFYIVYLFVYFVYFI